MIVKCLNRKDFHDKIALNMKMGNIKVKRSILKTILA